ncbi:MAG: serine/threonine protein kinase [Planctomycetes bacterium]|nr:serine/threonine protein kinase [Planctomycetota bacterium]
MLRKIAEGGMGAIYEAVLYGSEGFEKTVAIKTIRERYTADRDFVDMFIGEAKLVADLVHQNIVQIYKLGRVGATYYIAMEYVHGVNLQEFMNRHHELRIKVPIDLGAFIISRVCRGLDYAHSKRDRQGQLIGVVHRDISPKNMMISSEGEVKITDFGIAKARGLMKDQEGQVLMGKAQYMSPEQAQYMQTDRRSDIFSLGVVTTELLTGENVFGSTEETTIILNNVVHRELPRPRNINPDIPEALEKILMKALDRNVIKRYQDAGKMGYDLEYFMYHKGYGPTIVTLEKYMRQLFPSLYMAPLEGVKFQERPTSVPESNSADVLQAARTQDPGTAPKA